MLSKSSLNPFETVCRYAFFASCGRAQQRPFARSGASAALETEFPPAIKTHFKYSPAPRGVAVNCRFSTEFLKDVR